MRVTVQEASNKLCQEGFAACDGVSPSGVSSTATVATTPYFGAGGSYAHVTTQAPMYCAGPRCMAWEFDGETQDGTPTGYCGKVCRR